MLDFKERSGDCNVPLRHKESGFSLGKWVTRQRINKDILTLEQKKRLDSIKFTWDPLGEQWEEGFSSLLHFKDTHGHCEVPARLKVGEFNLGNWVHNQKTRLSSGKFSPERKQRLDAIGFVWTAK